MEDKKYVALHSNGEPSGDFGATPEAAAQEYIEGGGWESAYEEAPTTVTVAECQWQRPTDFTAGYGAVVCEGISEAVYDVIGEYADDITRALEREDVQAELEGLLRPLLDAWFTNLCQRQGGMNAYVCGEETEVTLSASAEQSQEAR